MQELYTLSRNYTAFMCCSDYYAVMLMTYFRDRGVKIPEDLSITGFDDVMIARVSLPALTTVHQNPTKKGRLAVDYLLRMVQGEEPSEWDTKLPVELVIRDSVKAVAPYGNDERAFTEE